MPREGRPITTESQEKARRAADLRIAPRAGGGRGELARELKRIHADDGVRVVRRGEPGQDAAEQHVGEAERAVVPVPHAAE